MNKYILTLFILLIAGAAFAQRPGTSRVRLMSSDSAGFNKLNNGKTVLKTYRGVFVQDYSTLTADSSLYYSSENMVDAFGHVVINQGDTLHIFSDKLHYDGNTKLATLTGNVKLVDKDATLTTNYFTYNTATKIGTYTDGGKLFNQENTLTSKNGYYFAGTRDAYFRYNVVLTTPDAVIKTDTLRYNSGSRISWFYGPTNIYGTKDNDVLYTENGRYETIPEQAFFGKNNLYTQGSKTLKGDSLFYDRLKGYGRAVKNVVFDDKEQRATVKGHLGEYYRGEEKAVITQKPYVIFVTQDSSKNAENLKADSVDTIAKDSLTITKVDTSAIKALTTAALSTAQAKTPVDSLAPAISALKPTLQAITDSVMRSAVQQTIKAVPNASVAVKGVVPQSDGLKDSLNRQRKAKIDSMYMGADTIMTRVITYKKEKEMKLARYLLDNPDLPEARKPSIILTKATQPKVLSIKRPPFPADSSFMHRELLGMRPKPATKPAAAKTPPKDAPQTKPVIANVKRDTNATKIDTAALNINKLSDTSKVRIIIGYRAAKIFKSDLQAKADSMFYSSSDSVIRMYVNPIIWTQGSQLTGDTINLQMKNRKLDNIDLFPNGFIVNIEKNDSLNFNQSGGRKIHGIFKDNRLSSMEITGNAESIYFNRDSVKNVVTEIGRSASNSLITHFENGRLSRAKFFGNNENKIKPLIKVKDDDKILKGFIWKPQERPQSKEAIIGSGKVSAGAVAPAKPPAGKNPAQTATPAPAVKTDSKTPANVGEDKAAAPAKPIMYDVIISN